MTVGLLRIQCLTALLAVLLGACSSSKKQTGQKPMSDSMRSRVMSTDMNKRSSFESALVTKNSGMGSYLGKQGYKSKEYSGTNQYRMPKTLKQEAFSGASDRSRMGSQSFQQGKEQSRLASEKFKTSAATEAGQSARQQGQMFSGANDTFKTGSVRDAAKSQADNKRPLIVKPDGGQVDETPYTEDEIRRMVNRR